MVMQRRRPRLPLLLPIRKLCSHPRQLLFASGALATAFALCFVYIHAVCPQCGGAAPSRNGGANSRQPQNQTVRDSRVVLHNLPNVT